MPPAPATSIPLIPTFKSLRATSLEIPAPTSLTIIGIDNFLTKFCRKIFFSISQQKNFNLLNKIFIV